MLTAVLHTRNRPEFLERALTYYTGKFRHPILVMDGSDEPQFARTKQLLSGLKLSFPFELVHHAPSTPFYERLSDALRRMTTPYVMLMADDDFYFESWPDKALDYLERNSSCGVVYGHTVKFEVEGYRPYGDASKFELSVPTNPVARWLEHPTAVERLNELGKSPWNTHGWYAVQRVEIFQEFISTALSENLDIDMGERLLSILQPIRGTIAMLDTVYLARQFDARLDRKPSAFDAEALEKLERISIDALRSVSTLDYRTARQVVQDCMRPEVRQLEANERRAKLRIDSIKNLPVIRQAARTVKTLLNRVGSAGESSAEIRDPRFPRLPSLEEASSEIRTVKKYCVSPR